MKHAHLNFLFAVMMMSSLTAISCSTTQSSKVANSKTKSTKFSKHRLLDASLDPSKTNLASDLHTQSSPNLYEKGAAASSSDGSAKSSSCPTCGI